MGGNSSPLTVNDLVIVRGAVHAVNGLSGRLRAGTVNGLLGPSGCGKTTLMRAIVGVQRITSGQITVLGLPAGCAELRRKVAYTTQAPAMYYELSVRENLEFFAAAGGTPRNHIESALERTSLGDVANNVVGRLSGGQQARVSLAIALLSDADLMILDEPTVGLDPLLRIELWRDFRDLAAQGKTLMISSHVLDEATHCDNLWLMRDGRMLAEGSPGRLCDTSGTSTIEEAFVSLVRKGTEN